MSRIGVKDGEIERRVCHGWCLEEESPDELEIVRFAGPVRVDATRCQCTFQSIGKRQRTKESEEHHPNRRQTALGSQIDHILQSIENAESTSVNSSTTPDNNDEDGMSISVVATTSVSENAEKQYQQIEKLRRKLAKAKAKIKLLEVLTRNGNYVTMIDIGNGVMLNAAVLERATLFSFSPSILD
ncbi:unnamed protein product [Allacma fusca]|uniref:Uncharacterized protein n=1 Tax=Allacma fusca TaxID=39272 RepID=A0A8J2KFN5_9HEXA|nr:unnamed protein product [Allacma fusca]